MNARRPFDVDATADVVVAVALSIYTFVIRTRGIADHFLLLGDQVRDWKIALRPLTGLPLVGAPSNGGGNSLGPVYYWVLWTARITIGPFVNNLPHAGGLGLSAMQSVADGVLFVGIRKTSGSWMFAAATVLLVASAPLDLALSSVVWNPVVAVAFSKIAFGLLLLWRENLNRPRRLALFTVSWLAVQAHSPALPVAAAIFCWLVLTPIRRADFRRALIVMAEGAAVVAVLQIPSLFASASVEPTRVVEVLAHPRPPRVLDALGAVSDSIEFAAAPFSVPQIRWVLLVVAATVVAAAGIWTPIAVATVWPIGLTILFWSVWQYPYDGYLFLAIVPSAVLMTVWGTRLVPTRTARTIAAALLLVFAVAIQRPRIQAAARLGRLPGYGALVSGARAIVRRGQPVRSIDAPFLEGTDPEFVFRILGGDIDPNAAVAARITAGGGVTYIR